MTPQMQQLLGEMNQRARVMLPSEVQDELLDALELAAPKFDVGWDKSQGQRPSSIKIIRYCVLLSSGNAEAMSCGRDLARTWLRDVGQAVPS